MSDKDVRVDPSVILIPRWGQCVNDFFCFSVAFHNEYSVSLIEHMLDRRLWGPLESLDKIVGDNFINENKRTIHLC